MPATSCWDRPVPWERPESAGPLAPTCSQPGAACGAARGKRTTCSHSALSPGDSKSSICTNRSRHQKNAFFQQGVSLALFFEKFRTCSPNLSSLGSNRRAAPGLRRDASHALLGALCAVGEGKSNNYNCIDLLILLTRKCVHNSKSFRNNLPFHELQQSVNKYYDPPLLKGQWLVSGESYGPFWKDRKGACAEV